MFNRSFRLISLAIKNHKVLGTSSFVFCNDTAKPGDSQELYTTVIIGRNGIGKSFLLKVIVDILNYIYDINHAESMPRSLGYSFKIEFRCDGHHFVVDNNSQQRVHVNARLADKIACYRDGINTGLHNCDLPEVVIASAMTVSDKFVIRGEKDRGAMYCYQGIRNEKSPGTTGTRTLVRKTVNGLIKCLKANGDFREEIKLLLKVLKFKQTLKIEYSFRYIDEFVSSADIMTPDLLRAIFDKKEGHFANRKTDLWGKKKFDTIRNDEEKLAIICDYYRRMFKNKRVQKYKITYDVFERQIERDYDAISLLSDLDLLSFPSLLVEKDEQYDFTESSSGETHLLSHMIGIMSDIRNGGLVLIDEPETSSHPNWQIKYIEWLQTIFHNYSSCHFIISTHSHFILSGLKPTHSSIIALHRNEETGELENLAEDMDTYGWTTDDILYEVFRVRNPRNEALDRDLERAIHLLEGSGPMTQNEINGLLSRFRNVYLGAHDPLGKFIAEVEEYAKSRS